MNILGGVVIINSISPLIVLWFYEFSKYKTAFSKGKALYKSLICLYTALECHGGTTLLAAAFPRLYWVESFKGEKETTWADAAIIQVFLKF